ncbi:hypothetical protein H6P81_014553 [Aristolochia fimbriata]|uniref:XMAP215/Dis1/CLASP TOG domain-containing protein n=1 Tax=Aristolochia fimbriata TaxID=158543 RepID=A0AAV7EHV5_ARIFI|nr:hypothetical protein H6P81_014553 [Aristolochia fimbriata]
MEEMLSEDEKLLKEAKKLPWGERLLNKNWKVQNDAYIDVASLLDSINDQKDPRLRDFGIPNLMFTGPNRETIKNEVGKAVVPARDVMFQALGEFGAKVVPPKRILKMLPKLFDLQDRNVVASLKGLTLELCCRIGKGPDLEKAIKNKVAKAVVPSRDNVGASSKGLTLERCCWIGKDPVKSILHEKMRDAVKKVHVAELVNVCGTAKPSCKIPQESLRECAQRKEQQVEAPKLFRVDSLIGPKLSMHLPVPKFAWTYRSPCSRGPTGPQVRMDLQVPKFAWTYRSPSSRGPTGPQVHVDLLVAKFA